MSCHDDHLSYFIMFFQLGNNSSSVGGKTLNKGGSVCLGPGGTFCILGDSYRHFIHFNSTTSSGRNDAEGEPSAKKARYDTLSDSDEDHLTSEDLEDIGREFGQEMVEKIQKTNKNKDDSNKTAKKEDLITSRSVLKDSWEDIDQKLIVFTSSGIKARSKVCMSIYLVGSDLKAVTWSVSSLSEAIKGLWVVCHSFYTTNKLKESVNLFHMGINRDNSKE